MKPHQAIRLFIASLLCSTVTSIAAQAGITPTQITIGQTISAGEKASYPAAASTLGIRLMIDKANASGGVGGRRIVIKTLDDQGRADLAETNARNLVKQGVFLLFAPHDNGPSMSVAKVADETGVVLFAPMAGSPALSQPSRPLVFPIRASHRVEFAKLLGYAQTMNVNNVAFFRSDSALGQTHAESLRAEAGRTKRTVVADLPYREDFTDQQIDDLVAQAKEAKAEVIINQRVGRDSCKKPQKQA